MTTPMQNASAQPSDEIRCPSCGVQTQPATVAGPFGPLLECEGCGHRWQPPQRQGWVARLTPRGLTAVRDPHADGEQINSVYWRVIGSVVGVLVVGWAIKAFLDR